MFGELPVLSNTVLIITVCVKVANSTFLVTNKRTQWAELSRYYPIVFLKLLTDGDIIISLIELFQASTSLFLKVFSNYI